MHDKDTNKWKEIRNKNGIIHYIIIASYNNNNKLLLILYSEWIFRMETDYFYEQNCVFSTYSNNRYLL